MTTQQCSSDDCEVTFDPDHDDCRYSPLLEGYYCWGCYESLTEGSSQVWFIYPDGNKERWIVNEFEITNEYGDEPYGETPATGLSRGWTRSDASRGHYDTKIDDWVEVMAGWTTQDWGDSVSDRKQAFNHWAEDMIQNEDAWIPCPIAIVADPTSNLFSVGVAVWVRPGDEKTFADYLRDEAGLLESSIR